MLHIEVVASDFGCKGEGEFLEAPHVAKFKLFRKVFFWSSH